MSYATHDDLLNEIDYLMDRDSANEAQIAQLKAELEDRLVQLSTMRSRVLDVIDILREAVVP